MCFVRLISRKVLVFIKTCFYQKACLLLNCNGGAWGDKMSILKCHSQVAQNK